MGSHFGVFGEFTTHFRTYLAMGLLFGVDEHPFATSFDVHQGYRGLTHSHFRGWIGMFTEGTIWLLTHGHMAPAARAAPSGDRLGLRRERGQVAARAEEEAAVRDSLRGQALLGVIQDTYMYTYIYIYMYICMYVYIYI